MTTPDLLTTTDVARLLGVTTGRVRFRRQLLAAKGVDVGRRMSSGWVYTPEDVERLRPGAVGRPKAKDPK
jgi:hypothetical protein